MHQPFSQAYQQAMVAAKVNNQRPIEALELALLMSPQGFTEWLAEHLSYSSISLSQMLALQPAFERVSFSDCLQHECVLLRKLPTVAD